MEPYEPLKMEIIDFDGEDIITTSGFTEDGDWPPANASERQERQGGEYTC